MDSLISARDLLPVCLQTAQTAGKFEKGVLKVWSEKNRDFRVIFDLVA